MKTADFKKFPFFRMIRTAEWPAQSFDLPKIQVHRGYWRDGLQENTMEAFRAAHERGALMVECDVRLSKDLVPVVVHDTDTQRVAEIALEVAETLAVDLYEKANVPSLEQVLKNKGLPKYFNIEIKTKNILNESLERRICDVVQSTNSEKRVMFSSFNPISLWKASQFLPHVPRALLATQSEDPSNTWALRTMALAPFLELHMLNLDHKMLDLETAHQLLDQEVPFSVWTVDEESQIKHFLNVGATSVITDLAIQL